MLIAKTRKVTQSLRAYITLSEDLSSVPSILVRRFTNACNSNFKGPYTSVSVVTTLRNTISYTDTCTHAYLKIKC